MLIIVMLKSSSSLAIHYKTVTTSTNDAIVASRWQTRLNSLSLDALWVGLVQGAGVFKPSKLLKCHLPMFMLR